MESMGSVTKWLQSLKAGEEQALAELFSRYWKLLVGLARKSLGRSARRAADEEDVAQRAFWGFYQSFKRGHLPRLNNRDDFLKLLTLIVARKAASQIRHQKRLKRGAGQTQGQSALDAVGMNDVRGLEQVATDERGPDEIALARDAYEHYLDALPHALREFAQAWLAGCTEVAIAEAQECSVRTVERKLKLIREEWKRLAEDSVK